MYVCLSTIVCLPNTVRETVCPLIGCIPADCEEGVCSTPSGAGTRKYAGIQPGKPQLPADSSVQQCAFPEEYEAWEASKTCTVARHRSAMPGCQSGFLTKVCWLLWGEMLTSMEDRGAVNIFFH